MYNKVVVPLDGSALAEVALPYAEEMAGKMGSKITLLSVLASQDAEQESDIHRYLTRVIDHTRHQVTKYTEPLEKEDIKVESATRAGNPAEEILDFVTKGSPCLTVMATHGRSGLTRWAVGSVADKIVRASNMQPVLLIRANGAHPDVRAKRILKRILIPLDGSSGSEAVIPHIIQIAGSLKMEVFFTKAIKRVNNGYKEAEEYLQEWCHRVEEKSIQAQYHIRTGPAAEEIIDLADELASDIVAMTTRGQSSTSLWPLGSVAQKILLAGNTPLLLIKA